MKNNLASLKVIPCFYVLLALGSCGVFSNKDEGYNFHKKHIYLLIGQSNMAGRAPLNEEDKGIIEGVYLSNNKNEWELASNPLNRYSTIKKVLNTKSWD